MFLHYKKNIAHKNVNCNLLDMDYNLVTFQILDHDELFVIVKSLINSCTHVMNKKYFLLYVYVCLVICTAINKLKRLWYNYNIQKICYLSILATKIVHVFC